MPSARKPSRSTRRSQGGRRAQEKPQQLGRLTRFSIGGLFGLHSHEFDLETEEPTILTGANGTGKSTILRAIDAAGNGRWLQLFALPFESLSLQFEHASAPLVILKDEPGLRIAYGNQDWPWDPRRSRFIPARHQPDLVVEGPEGEFILGEFKQPTETVGRFGTGWTPAAADRALLMEQLSLYQFHSEKEQREPQWLERILSGISVRYVKEQRLVIYEDDGGRAIRSERREDSRDAVAVYANELKRRITRAKSEFGTATEQEDQAVQHRLIDAVLAEKPVNVDELRALLEEIERRREALQRVGLLDKGDLPTPRYEAGTLEHKNVGPMIRTLSEATLRKFDVLEDLRRQLQLFVGFLDERFIDKRAVTNDEVGLIFELAHGGTVTPTDLSSGEQQMLVLAYRLLFDAEPDTLLLVDEPELSLHVAWQTSFVDDITEIGRDRHLQFLFATHSPVLIGGREDLLRSLDTSRR